MERSQEITTPAKRSEVLEREVVDLRNELGLVVHEIERRIRHAVSVREQARHHPLMVAAVAAGLTAVTTLVIQQAIHRRRERASRSRITNLRIALRHLMEYPEDVFRKPSPSVRGALLGAGKSAGTFGAKRLVRRWL